LLDVGRHRRINDCSRKTLFYGWFKGARGEANDAITRICKYSQQKAGDKHPKDWKLSIGERFDIDAMTEDAVLRRDLHFQPRVEIFDVQLEVSCIAAHVPDRERAAWQILEPTLLNSG